MAVRNQYVRHVTPKPEVINQQTKRSWNIVALCLQDSDRNIFVHSGLSICCPECAEVAQHDHASDRALHLPTRTHGL
jgi:hypothetical protein